MDWRPALRPTQARWDFLSEAGRASVLLSQHVERHAAARRRAQVGPAPVRRSGRRVMAVGRRPAILAR
jgi:hypothetical protein